MRPHVLSFLCLIPRGIFGQAGAPSRSFGNQVTSEKPASLQEATSSTIPGVVSVLSSSHTGGGETKRSNTPRVSSEETTSSTSSVAAVPVPSTMNGLPPLKESSVPTPDSSTETSRTSVTPSRSNSVPKSATPSSVPPTDACWASNECRMVMNDFSQCYDKAGAIKDPNDRGAQDKQYQRCLCIDRTGYKNIILQSLKEPSEPIQKCMACLQQAGIDVHNSSLSSMKLEWKIHDFCNTQDPNMFDLLFKLLNWLKDTSTPSSPGLPAEMSSITNFASIYVSKTGINRPTTIPKEVPRPDPDSIVSWWERRLTFGDAIPTEYLSQLPSNWPYTSYGVARQPGMTASFPFVNPNVTTQTVAWLFHSLVFNPRPLFTPAAYKPSNANATMYQPYLEGWTHAFFDARTPIPDIPVTNPATMTSVYATPSFVGPNTTRVPTSSSGVISKYDGPVRPTQSQDPVLPLDPDPSDMTPFSSTQTSSNGRLVLAMDAALAQVTPTTVSVVTYETALDVLWDNIKSIVSRLDH